MAEAERKFQSMHNAMEKLRELSPKLYEAANKDEDPRARSTEEMEIWKSLKKSERRAFDSSGLFWILYAEVVAVRHMVYTILERINSSRWFTVARLAWRKPADIDEGYFWVIWNDIP